jgi:hypothetical protein
MMYAQTFSHIWITTNGNSTIDVNVFVFDQPDIR